MNVSPTHRRGGQTGHRPTHRQIPAEHRLTTPPLKLGGRRSGLLAGGGLGAFVPVGDVLQGRDALFKPFFNGTGVRGLAT